MKLNEVLSSIDVWTTEEEQRLLNSIKDPVTLSSLPERDQYLAQVLVRKGLLKKIGYYEPKIVKN